jgi:soluble lytic murein transglycosylase
LQLRVASLLTGLLFATHVACASDDSLVDEAHAAFKSRNASRLGEIAARGRNHPLAPYFAYWQIMLAPSDGVIRGYLERYPNTVLADQLRADWIRGLGRRADWAQIEPESRKVVAARADDVRCWGLRARWERGDQSAGAAVATDWRGGRDLAEPCLPVAEALVRNGKLSSAEVWTRARRLVELGQYAGARRVLAWLPAGKAPSAKLVDRALGTPEQMLGRGMYDARQTNDREMVAFALVRIANDDPDRALRYLQGGLGALSPEQRGWVNGQLGLAAARKLHPRALDWFRGSAQARLSDEHYAWWIRAAAREGAWSDVGLAVELLSVTERRSSVWQYWLARSFAERGQASAAEEIFTRVAGNGDFYGVLAGEELGGRALPPSSMAAATALELATVARDPSIQRAIALMRADLRMDSLREWLWAIRAWDDRTLHAAAQYAESIGLWDRAVETADRTRSAFDVATRYPFAHANAIRAGAKAAKMEPEWVFAVARQESRFNPTAYSHAGATGLMQVMPATGAMVAANMGMPGAATTRLRELDFNAAIGARYFKSLVDESGGSTMLAMAGYNAGPGRAHGWRGAKTMEAAAYAESIPFDETRDYVKRVATNFYYYQMRASGVPVSLKAALGLVPASATVASAQASKPVAAPVRTARK